MSARAFCTAGMTLLVLVAFRGSARAQSEGVLDLNRARVLELVRAHDPRVMVAEARIEESRALSVGAGILATSNPVLGISGGLRRFSEGATQTEVAVQLSWPIDVSRARGHRMALAEERTLVAQADADEALRIAYAEALDLFAQLSGANARIELESARLELDQELLRITRARRDAGAIGDADVALATIIAAEATARLQSARGLYEELAALLRPRLGVGAQTPLRVQLGVQDEAAPPALEAFLARLERRPDLARARAAEVAARTDASLQASTGIPVPALVGEIGHESELFGRLGVNVPLPVYQRNQTARAVANARVATAAVETVATRGQAEAQLRAAYVAYTSARDALATLQTALPAVDDAEHLATRGFELGQRDLASVVGVRREANLVRVAYLDTLIALARARIALERAGDLYP